MELSIKGVPEEQVATLRERAKANHRSLQGELRALIEDATGARPRRLSVEEIAAKAGTLGLTRRDEAVRLIREDRDRYTEAEDKDAALDEPGPRRPGPAERIVGPRRGELAVLCRRYRVHRLELFGSAAAGTDRPGESDLDFLVEFEAPPPASYADTYFGLKEALEELFGRPVDLVVASAVRNPYFRASVERTKTLLYAA
jgi:uncharacterized protein